MTGRNCGVGMITVLDVETTTTLNKKEKQSPSPFLPENRLVCVGFKAPGQQGAVVWFGHNHKEATVGGFKELQYVLDQTTLLVGHNIKFDLQWLLEAGFEYDGLVYDTMLVEYIMNRSRKTSLKLGHLAEKHDVSRKATDLTQEYLDRGVGFEEMPWEVVEEYNLQDLQTTEELAEHQLERLGVTWEDFYA